MAVVSSMCSLLGDKQYCHTSTTTTTTIGSYLGCFSPACEYHMRPSHKWSAAYYQAVVHLVPHCQTPTQVSQLTKASKLLPIYVREHNKMYLQ